MAVWKEGSGKRPWRCRYYDENGHERLQSFSTKKLADEFERAIGERKARIRAGLPVSAGPIKYDDLCQLYLDNYTARSKPWFEGMLRHSRDRFGKTLVHLLRPEQIGAWLHSELDLSPKTRLSILTAMRQVLAAAVEWNYLSANPARPKAVKPPRLAPPRVFPIDSWDEVLKVAAAADHYGPLIRFACATGLRPQEWSTLEWNDIDREARVVNVRGQKTAAARRAVVLSRPALHALDDTVRRLDTPLVFITKTGRPIVTKKWGQRVWRPALGVAGLQDRPSYQMRHTYATLALAQGIPLEWISGQMGHESYEITRKHYARFVKRVDDRMRALLDDLEVADGHADARLSD